MAHFSRPLVFWSPALFISLRTWSACLLIRKGFFYAGLATPCFMPDPSQWVARSFAQWAAMPFPSTIFRPNNFCLTSSRNHHGTLNGISASVVSDVEQDRLGKHHVGRDSAEPRQSFRSLSDEGVLGFVFPQRLDRGFTPGRRERAADFLAHRYAADADRASDGSPTGLCRRMEQLFLAVNCSE